MGVNGLSREEEIFLVEYQAAQSSAEHHDTLVWTVTSIIWGANLVLLGFVLTVIDKPALRCLILTLPVMGIILCLSVWIFALQFREIKSQKYERCVEIEEILGMKQHSDLTFPGRQKLKRCKLITTILGIKQWVIYLFIMGTFIGLWIGIICFVLVCLS